MKKNALVIYRLNGFTLPFMRILYKFFDYEIYYLELGNKFKDINTVNVLERRGIKWIKKGYSDFSQYDRGARLAVKFAEKIYEIVQRSFINHFIGRSLLAKENQKEKMDIIWKYYFFKIISPFAWQYAAAEHIQQTNNYEKIIILASSSFARLLKRTLDKQIKVFIFFDHTLLSEISQWVQSKFKKMRSAKDESPVQNDIRYDEQFLSKKINPEDVEVVYFPHQGIFYGEMFKKDHFYNEDIKSPFHKSKILHVSLGEKNADYMSQSYKYYHEANIPFLDLYDLDYSKANLRKSFLSLLCRVNIKFFSDIYRFGFFYIVYALHVFRNINKYCLRFLRFKNLKFALIGYDYVFLHPLLMALSLLGAKICATQERFIIAFFPDNYLILDYYFVASHIIKEPCLKTSSIDHFIPVGLVRVDKIFEYEKKQVFDEKYDSIKKEKKLVMALDFFLPANDIEDISRPAAKVCETRQFYSDLILLALEFPSLHIVIKGKEADSYKSHYISDIVEKINEIDNLSIELDYGKYNPYYIGEKVDLTIACHTSLCDELLAAGRKVILYEITDRLNTLFNYENLPIIAGNYPELKRHVENFLNGIYLDEDKINEIKEKFFSNCYHGNVQANIQSVLEDAYSNS
jgi:hypothetical protein